MVGRYIRNHESCGSFFYTKIAEKQAKENGEDRKDRKDAEKRGGLADTTAAGRATSIVALAIDLPADRRVIDPTPPAGATPRRHHTLPAR
jgi:hypothetical protein